MDDIQRLQMLVNRGEQNKASIAPISNITAVQQHLNKTQEPYNINLFKDIMSQNKDPNNPLNMQYQQIEDAFTTAMKDLGNVNMTNDHIKKLDEYDAIVRKISYGKRALKVIVSNILNPDYFQKKTMMFNANDPDDKKQKEYIKKMEYVRDNLRIKDNEKSIIKRALKYGYQDIEIVNSYEDLKQNDVLMENKHVSRNTNMQIDFSPLLEQMEPIGDINTDKLNSSINLEFINFDTNNDFDSIIGSPITSDSPSEYENESIFEDVMLNFYIRKLDQRKVIKIGNENLVHGYVEIFNTSNSNGLLLKNVYDIKKNQFKLNTFLDNILNELNTKLKNIITNSDSDIKKRPEVQTLLSNILYNINLTDPNNNIQIRFIKPENVVRFYNEDFDEPESIFHDTEFNQKLLTLSMTSATISKITDAVQRETVYVDIGLTRDGQAAIQKIKQQLNKQRVSIDQYGSCDDIPTNLTSYNTLYIPQKDGKRFIERQREDESSRSDKQVDDMKFMRDMFVSQLDIPPQFLGLEENMGNYSTTLSQQNLLFQRSISELQDQFSKQFTHFYYILLLKIFNHAKIEIDKEALSNINVEFNKPTQLKNQLESEHINTVISIIGNLTQLYGEKYKEFFINKYLGSMFDKEEMEAFLAESNINRHIQAKSNTDEENNDMMMGGGY